MAVLSLFLTGAVFGTPTQQPRQPKPPVQRPQKPPRPLPAPKNRNPDATIERIRKTLHLTDSQVFQLRPLVSDRNSELDMLDQSGEKAELRKAEAQRVQQRFESALRILLTSEQAYQFDRLVLSKPGTFH